MSSSRNTNGAGPPGEASVNEALAKRIPSALTAELNAEDLVVECECEVPLLGLRFRGSIKAKYVAVNLGIPLMFLSILGTSLAFH